LTDAELERLDDGLVATVRKNVDDRLDLARERPRSTPRARQAQPAQMRLSPDKQEKVTQLILAQAALLSDTWAASA
jgi:hypothetical protein